MVIIFQEPNCNIASLCKYCCDQKSRVACAQSFAPWQQATIEIMLAISLRVRLSLRSIIHKSIGRASTSQSLFLLLARATYIMVLFFTHILFVVNHTINATPPERLQHYLYLPKENKERKPCHGTMEASFDLLSTCLLIKKFHCDATLCSNLGNEKSNAGHIKCSRGPQAPHPTKHDNAQIKSPSMLSLRLYFVFMATRTACLPLNALSNCIVHNGKLCGNFHVAIISNT